MSLRSQNRTQKAPWVPGTASILYWPIAPSLAVFTRKEELPACFTVVSTAKLTVHALGAPCSLKTEFAGWAESSKPEQKVMLLGQPVVPVLPPAGAPPADEPPAAEPPRPAAAPPAPPLVDPPRPAVAPPADDPPAPEPPLPAAAPASPVDPPVPAAEPPAPAADPPLPAGALPAMPAAPAGPLPATPGTP